MTKWNREGRKGLSLTEYLLVYRKGGYLENNLYSSIYKNYYHKSGFGLEYMVKGLWNLFKTIFTKGWAFICWSNDVAVVTGKNSHYIVAVFSVSKQLNPKNRFPMEKLAKTIYDFMELLKY